MDTNPLRAAKARGPCRHHTREFKLAVVEQGLQPGASVTRVAREQGLNANQVFAWRRLYRAGDLAAVALDELRDAIPVTQGQGIIEGTTGGRFRRWTFAGSRANRTRMFNEAACDAYRFDGLSVDYRLDPRIHAESITPAPIGGGGLRN